MKALVYDGPHRMSLRDVPAPACGPDDVLVRVTHTGICGSELSGFLGQNTLRGPGTVFGHEFSGRVQELGSHADRAADGSSLEVGQPVTANPFVGCGSCSWCRSGNEQHCADRLLLSASLPGANAELVRSRPGAYTQCPPG